MLYLAMFQMLDIEMVQFFLFSSKNHAWNAYGTRSPNLVCSLVIKVVNLMIYMTSEES